MGENSHSKRPGADSASSGFVDGVKKATAEQLGKGIVTAVLGVLAITWVAIEGLHTPALPVWAIVVAAIFCAGVGAVIEYVFFARMQIEFLKQQNRKLNDENSRLKPITRLNTSKDLKNRIWEAVTQIWPQREGPVDSGKALSLAVLAIHRLEEISRDYTTEVVDRLLNTLEKAVNDARPRDTDNVYFLNSKFYVVIRDQPDRDNAAKLPERILERSRKAQTQAWTLPDGRSSPNWRVCAGIAEFEMPYGNPERREERILALLANAQSALNKSYTSDEQRIVID